MPARCGAIVPPMVAMSLHDRDFQLMVPPSQPPLSLRPEGTTSSPGTQLASIASSGNLNSLAVSLALDEKGLP